MLLDQVPYVEFQELKVSPLLPVKGIEGATSVGASLGSTADGNKGL